MKPRKIAFFGLFGQNNLGNECSLQAMIYHTRKHLRDAELKCVCTGPEDIRTRYEMPAFDMYAPASEMRRTIDIALLSSLQRLMVRALHELRHGVRAFKDLRGTDLLIAPGTGLLVDNTTGFRGYPFYVLKWAIIAKLCRCKFLIVSIGAGPIHHPLSRLFIKTALRLAAYRSYRDTFSKRYIEGIGFPADADPVYPDLAFSLPEDALTEGVRDPVTSTTVGVGLIDYFGQGSSQKGFSRASYDDYVDKTATFIAGLLDKGYRVRLLIGDITYDRDALKDVLSHLEKLGVIPDNGRVIHEPIDTVKDLLGQLAKTDIVVSPRFHNIILSLMLKKRVIALSYNEKFESLMAEFGLERYCQRLEDLDIEKLAKLVRSLDEDHGDLDRRIYAKTEEYRSALDGQYQAIFCLEKPRT